MPPQSKPLMLWKNDPLLYLFKEKLHFSSLLTTLTLTAVVAIALLGFGWIASQSYTGTGLHFTDSQVWLQLALFAIPGQLIWLGFYTWQPGALARMFHSLEQTGVIQDVSNRGRQHVQSYSDLLHRFQAEADSRRWTAIAMLCAVAIGVFEALVAMPAQFGLLGRSSFLYDVAWFRAVVLVTLCVWQYVVCMIGFKLLHMILCLNRLFQWFNIRIRPLHPDEAGGLGELGNFTLTAGLSVVGAGVFAAVFSAIDWLSGANPLARPDLLLFWVLYILGTPISIVLPILAAHKAMQNTRNARLNEIAQEFEKTLSDASVTRTGDAEAIKKANEKLQELQTRYSLVAASLPTWPIPARLFRSFSITASLPLLSGLVSWVINLATRLGWVR